MTRPNSIRGKGLEKHVNQYCEQHGIKRTYKDLDHWLKKGDEYGDPITAEWLRRRFKHEDGKLPSRPTMASWITVYKEEHNDLQSR